MSSVLAVSAVLAGLIVLFVWRSLRRRRALLATVETVVLPDVYSEYLDNSRDVVVFLPPGYHNNPTLRYDVLFVNDGQEAEALGLRETLADLMRTNRMRTIITVAVPANDDRLQEYGTSISPSGRGLGARAGQFAEFVVKELKPAIDRQFRTSAMAAYLGVSLGGLSAFDIVWNHPEQFTTVGVFSGSFWWHTAPEVTPDVRDYRIAHAMLRTSVYRPGFRAFFQAGTRDEVMDRDGDGVIDAIQDTLELVDELAALGYEVGDDLVYIEVPGGRHDWETWARVLPQFLLWAFSPAQGRRAG